MTMMLRPFVASLLLSLSLSSSGFLLLAALDKVDRVSSFSFQSCHTKANIKASIKNGSIHAPYSLNFHTSKLNTQLYSSPWETAATYNRKNTNNNTNNKGGASATKRNANYNNNNKYNYKQRDPTTELNRTKSLLNQARGNLQESEMRATAAEHRVALLQNELKVVNGKIIHNGADENGSNGETSKMSTFIKTK